MSATQQTLDTAGPERGRRRSRWGLYAPFIALGVLALAWTIGWLVIRSRAESGLDAWLDAELADGRRWSCADRAVAGYPFRIELRCASLSLERPDARASLGPLLVVAQVYRPRHLIAEIGGPLRLTAGPTTVEGGWRLMRLSVILAERSFERASLAADDAALKIASPGLGPVDLASRRFEAHLRPRADSGSAYDVVARVSGAAIPGLDWLIGGTEPADAEMMLAVTEAAILRARPISAELERWRLAGGKVELSRLVLAKGQSRAEAKGALGLDPEHHLQGELAISAANLAGFLGRFVGERSGLGGAVLGALLGRNAPPSTASSAASAMRPLPMLRLEGGRIYAGPLAIPGIRLQPLY